MNTKTTNEMSPLRKLGYASAVISGGVVGSDYATSLELNPMVGAIIGSMAGTLTTKLLYHLKDDPGSQILNTLMGIGGFIGAIVGAYFGYQVGTTEAPESVATYAGGGLFGGMFLGALTGKLVAGLISLSAFFLLFISRGPIGIFLRNMIAREEPAAENVTETSMQLIELTTSLPWLG